VPFLDRNGVKIYYEEHGHGPAILLSHGYAATCRMWDRQVALSPHTTGSSSGICAAMVQATTPRILPPIPRR
jgi:pimeloyl-ACP methyl ester carboxylesterase